MDKYKDIYQTVNWKQARITGCFSENRWRGKKTTTTKQSETRMNASVLREQMGLTFGLDEGYVSKLVMEKERLFQFTLIGKWSLAFVCCCCFFLFFFLVGDAQLRVSAAGRSEGGGV